jgi:hypothetical protein
MGGGEYRCSSAITVSCWCCEEHVEARSDDYYKKDENDDKEKTRDRGVGVRGER